MEWSRSGGQLASVVESQTAACLSVYREDPSRVEQDANIERRIAEGGYRDRQLPELLQNAVDAAAREGGRRVEVLLTDEALYVANDGAPFDADGVAAVMASDISSKDDDRIGRFGIGFKSVLAISAEPRVLSRSVSFVFDRSWSAGRIRAAGHIARGYPVMRLARVVDPVELATADRRLPPLMEWATTVVVLPLTVAPDELAKKVETFPASFVLFSPHVVQVRLTVDTSHRKVDRSVTRRQVGPSRVVVREDEREQEWVLLQAEHHLTERARAAAGRIAGRSTIPLTWALPIGDMHRVGHFWTYFPTDARTTLAGIVNAPWQLSDDRANLISSAFNEELLTKSLPSLFVQGIPYLHEPEEPTRVLDALPARGREQRNWADDVVNEPLLRAALEVPCIPDLDGRLRRSGELFVPPSAVDRKWMATWAAARGLDRTRWVHPAAVATPERRHKVVTRLRAPADRLPSLHQWLSAAAEGGGVEASEDAVKLAAQMLQDSAGRPDAPDVERAVRQATLLMLEDGTLAQARRGSVHLRGDGQDGAVGTFVSPALAERPGVAEALGVLGISVLDARGRLEQLLADHQPDWEAIWHAARKVAPDTAVAAFETQLSSPLELTVKARTAAGSWALLARCLLAGRVIPPQGRRDGAFLIDPLFHAEDAELLRRLGAASEPERRSSPPMEPWRNVYIDRVTEDFREQSFKTRGSRPDASYVVVDGPPPSWPLAMLAALSPEGRVGMTLAVLEGGMPEPWHVRHRTSRTYGTTAVPSPVLWWLRSHGYLPTSFGPLPAFRCLSAASGARADVLPVVEVDDDTARALGARAEVDDLGEDDWLFLRSVADTWEDDTRRADFYRALDGRVLVEDVVVRLGNVLQNYPVAKVAVTSDPSVYDTLLEAYVPTLRASSSEDEVVFVAWGMQEATTLFKQEIVPVPSGEALLLLDEHRPLQMYLKAGDHDLLMQRCSRLSRLISTPGGQVEKAIRSVRDGGRVLVTADSPLEELRQVSDALDLGLDEHQLAALLEMASRDDVHRLRRRIREAAEVDFDLALVEAIGVESLTQQLPRQAVEALPAEGAGEPRRLAALARAVHGVGILRHFRDVLEARGLQPPRALTGGQTARRFVADLGLPLEWAGFVPRPRPALELVEGRPVLPALHPYQEVVTANIKQLLAGERPERGMVSLPTGAGKTRVAVQALVEGLRDGSLEGPIVWIGQSDELCEQAAETWSFLWRAMGPPGRLAIGRLWADNEVEEQVNHHQVVIATDHKLDAILSRTADGDAGEYEWLRHASVVVVDEAHSSVQPKYVRVLDWLGRSAGRARTGARLLGLSATPFRGTNDVQTSQLAAKYDRNRLDDGAFEGDPYEELQRMKVLAQVRHHVLDGVDVHFNDDERREIETYGRFPLSVERALGEDRARNHRIVDSIAGLPDDWPVLLFAPSVENARAIAALLSHRGVPAVSVSAETETAARRHYVEEFRAGRIRVLTNQNVLTQGFDAPAVRAVYVTRPTFSPNVYQQMVGRGLRGPANGGSEEVLIVNVQDNFDAYGERLAFREFDAHWRR